MKFIELLQSMLLDTGRVFINQKENGINATGIDHNLLDLESLKTALSSEYPTHDIKLFSASKKIDNNQVIDVPEMLCIFKPGQTASVADLDAALRSRK